jgi:hypothetical protein
MLLFAGAETVTMTSGRWLGRQAKGLHMPQYAGRECLC